MNEGELRRFRDEHGISKEVWNARPFERYQRDRSEAERIKSLYEGSGLRPGQLGDITKIVMNDRDGCTGGYVIHRNLARDVGAAPVYPQLRPDKPVAREVIHHWHADEPPSLWPRHPDTGNPIPEFRIYLKPPGGWGLSVQAHIDRGKDGREAHKDENLHRGHNCQTLNKHQVLAKYVFPSTPLKELDYEHQHDLIGLKAKSLDEALEALLAHIEKHHKGDDEHSFPRLDQQHAHKRTVKDTDKPLAQRLDVEPAFYDLLGNSDVVYFGIEGSVKGSAMTSAGVPTFTVPSVTMWPAKELDEFVRRYLMGKVVVIVPDNDWHENPAVVAQAFLCRTYLRRSLNVFALIAAPPADTFGEDGKLKKVGVDDFKAAGGDLLEMDVIDREVNFELYLDWIKERLLPRKGSNRSRKRHWIETLAVALEGFALHAKDGRVQLPYVTLAKVMGLHEKQVERAARDLVECGALMPDIDLIIRRGIYTPYGGGRGRYDPLGLEFAHKTTFTVAPELRVPDESKKLGAAVDASLGYLDFLTAVQRADWYAGQGVKTAVGSALHDAVAAWRPPPRQRDVALSKSSA